MQALADAMEAASATRSRKQKVRALGEALRLAAAEGEVGTALRLLGAVGRKEGVGWASGGEAVVGVSGAVAAPGRSGGARARARRPRLGGGGGDAGVCAGDLAWRGGADVCSTRCGPVGR